MCQGWPPGVHPQCNWPGQEGQAGADRTLWMLIVVSSLLRLAWAASPGPCNDEAYHFLFTVHPDWSYFDHPPMVAIVERAGLALVGSRPTVLGLRLGFVALAAGSTWLMARFSSRLYGPKAGFLAALGLNATAYYGIAAASFALPDGPLVFFWLMTLDRLVVAFRSPDRILAWVEVGLAWGGAMLSKYHAVFLPIGVALYVIFEPSARRWLRRPGPYLALAIGAAIFSPVVAWNAAHQWVSFAFQGGRALGRLAFRPDRLATALVGQAFYLFPWLWIAMLRVVARRGRESLRSSESTDRFLICQSIVPFIAFTAIACFRPVLPHWSLTAFLPIFPLLGRDWCERLARDFDGTRRHLAIVALMPVILSTLFAIHAATGLLQRAGSSSIGPPRGAYDPSVDLCGWDQLARELDRRGLTGDPRTFLFTSRWYQSGQLAFATKGAMPVLCYNRHRAQNFAYWSRPQDWVGHDGVFVGVNACEDEVRDYSRYFSQVKLLGTYHVLRGGQPIRTIHLYLFIKQIEPFPFGNVRKPDSGRSAARARRREGRRMCGLWARPRVVLSWLRR